MYKAYMMHVPSNLAAETSNPALPMAFDKWSLWDRHPCSLETAKNTWARALAVLNMTRKDKAAHGVCGAQVSSISWW